MTSVSEQLRRLALPETQILKKNDNKTASLLYDYSDAAKLDKETYYGLGNLTLLSLIWNFILFFSNF